MSSDEDKEPVRLGPFERDLSTELAERGFDWVDFTCACPDCGTQVRGFKTTDLCHQLDTVDYRVAHDFFAICDCGTSIRFTRKTALGIHDFDMYVEKLRAVGSN